MSISFQGYPKSWPVVNGLASSSSQTQKSAFCHPRKTVLGVIFGQKEFSRPNGRLSPIACHTYSESYASKAILVHFSAPKPNTHATTSQVQKHFRHHYQTQLLLQWHAKRQLLSSFNHLKTKILEHHLDIDQAGLNIAANVLLPNDGTDGNDNAN